MSRYLAFDIGASSGRAIVGILQDKILRIDEIYRFPNDWIKIDNSLYWNIFQIYSEILTGLKLYVNKYSSSLEGIGIDTWGVDFVLLDKNSELVGLPNHYRDLRTQGMLEKVFEKVPKEEIYYQTGIQFLEFNSLVQLYSMVINGSPKLSITDCLLMIPDYINFLLSGKKSIEYSIATTTQLYNPIKKAWANQLIERLGFDKTWFREVISPGTVLGHIRRNIAEEVGLNKLTKIITPACHDTGSAIAAIPVEMDKYSRGDWAYISSGTWSLLGVELNAPVINDTALKYNFTNEGGIGQTTRFLKNITGLWIIQECKKLWDREDPAMRWEDIQIEVEKAEAFQFLIDPSDSVFLNPDNMIYTIQEYCKKSGQETPKSIGEISRTIFESLVFRYKEVLINLEELISNKVKILHIIGGGASNLILNQFCANCLGIPVIAGPIEATAIGNILIQALSLKEIDDLNELRSIVKKSFELKTFLPEKTTLWDKAYKEYKNIIHEYR